MILGTLVADRFRIQERLGAGGMGVVYRAHQRIVDRQVAIKVLRPERSDDRNAAEQFLREARAVSQLSSPHTVTLIDVGPLETGGWFLAMELLDGVTLRQKMQDGPLAVAEAVQIADQVALSLGEAHARGIVHRDLKPLNVFLARTPGHSERVKVLDFGLATLTGTDGRASISSGGTPRYMAPEIITGGTSTSRADIYALGLMLYEMLCGRHPFDGLEGDALLAAQLDSTPETIANETASLALRKLVDRCVAKHPRLRPRDGTAFRKLLREAVGLPDDKPTTSAARSDIAPSGHDTKATLPSTMSLARLRERLRPQQRTSRWWAAPILALLAGGVWWQQQPRTAVSGASTTAPPAEPQATSSAATPSQPTAVTSAAEEPETVAILFHSIPDGATLFIHGQRKGLTPISVPLEKGVPVQARLDLAGYPTAELSVTPTRQKRVRHRFHKATRPASPVSSVDKKVDHYLD